MRNTPLGWEAEMYQWGKGLGSNQMKVCEVAVRSRWTHPGRRASDHFRFRRPRPHILDHLPHRSSARHLRTLVRADWSGSCQNLVSVIYGTYRALHGARMVTDTTDTIHTGGAETRLGRERLMSAS